MTNVRDLLHRNRLGILSVLLIAVAVVASWALVMNELQLAHIDADWIAFAVIAVLLIGCERTPSTWIRVGSAGMITPLPMFAFGLMLVGSPSFAVLIAVIGATTHAISQSEPVFHVVARVAGTAIALSSAGLILLGFGVRSPITSQGTLPWNWAGAIIGAGVAIVMLNAAVAALAMATQRRISFLALVQRGLAVRITAEGALLSLAPIWVIGVSFGVMLVPLLGITTVLVFRSTRQALERLHDAHHDALSGLLNRRAFLENLEESLDEQRSEQTLTTIVMDLDGFKDINDRLGHQLGDSLLVAFADRLESALPGNSTAARFGGDEFAVVMEHPDDDIDVPGVVESLQRALHEPLAVEGFPVSVGVSMGVAIAPEDGRTPRDLLRAADVAMYRAKRTGSSVEYYASCVQGPQRGRLNLLGDLDGALQNHELFIHFQPQISVTTGAVDTLEALIRWQHPEHGLIPPDEFIGLAEQTDLIAPITEMVLRVATRGLMNSGVTARLAVNVSPRNLQDPDFAQHVFDILLESGFRADRLELEVTERSIVDNGERCRFTIDQLRARGVRIAIDDFGTGYSSFQALRMLDVDRIKIDREFVQGILADRRDQLIVASVVDLAHDLGLDVVAEGVENNDLWRALAALGCDVAQGFGIARPMGYPELRGWLTRWSEVLVETVRQPQTPTVTAPRQSVDEGRALAAAPGT